MVAARAGASIGSLYQYFPNKQAIVRALIEREFKHAEAIRPTLIDGDGSKSDIVRAIVDWHFELRARDPKLALRLRALAAETLPEAERLKIATLRRERVARTVAKLVGQGLEAKRTHAAFIVDTCINAIADETMRRDPSQLKSEGLRAEVTALLIGYLEPD